MKRWRARTVTARRRGKEDEEDKEDKEDKEEEDKEGLLPSPLAPSRRGGAGLADASIALAVRDEDENGEVRLPPLCFALLCFALPL